MYLHEVLYMMVSAQELFKRPINLLGVEASTCASFSRTNLSSLACMFAFRLNRRTKWGDRRNVFWFCMVFKKD